MLTISSVLGKNHTSFDVKRQYGTEKTAGKILTLEFYCYGNSSSTLCMSDLECGHGQGP